MKKIHRSYLNILRFNWSCWIFQTKLKFERNINNIDGKALLDIIDESIKKLQLTFINRKELKKYINYYKTLKIELPIELKLTKESTAEEVVEYLKKRLKFSDEEIKSLNDLGMEGEDSLPFIRNRYRKLWIDKWDIKRFENYSWGI